MRTIVQRVRAVEGARRHAGATIGRVKWKVLPSPSLLSAQIRLLAFEAQALVRLLAFGVLDVDWHSGFVPGECVRD
jgi:hypothetical protein